MAQQSQNGMLPESWHVRKLSCDGHVLYLDMMTSVRTGNGGAGSFRKGLEQCSTSPSSRCSSGRSMCSPSESM